MVQYTFSARHVLDFCKQNQLEAKAHSAQVPGTLFEIIESGIRVTFANAKDEKVYLSIQTHPYWVKTAFAESAVQSDKLQKVVYPSRLGYCGDVIRHRNPQELFEHIKTINTKLEDENLFQHVYTDIWPEVHHPPVVLPPVPCSPDEDEDLSS